MEDLEVGERENVVTSWMCAVDTLACKQPTKACVQHKLAILSGPVITLAFVSKLRLISSGWVWP